MIVTLIVLPGLLLVQVLTDPTISMMGPSRRPATGEPTGSAVRPGALRSSCWGPTSAGFSPVSAAHDFYDKILNKGKDFSKQARLRISRIETPIVGAVGLTIAYLTEELVYMFVSYSATGLFSAFAPAFTLLFFWSDNLSKHRLIAAFLAGPITKIAWITLGMTDIVTVRLVAPPVGFAAAIIASLIWPRAQQSTSQPEGNPASQY
jgi:hypothetical protein